MNINQILLWVSWIAVLLFAVRVGQDRQQLGWFVSLGGVLLIMAIALTQAPQISGFLSFGAWVLLIVLPTLSAQQASSAIQCDRFGKAARWSTLASLLHPFDDWMPRSRLWGIVARRDRRGIEATSAALTRYHSEMTPVGRLAIGLTYAIEGQWSALLTWLRPVAGDTTPDPTTDTTPNLNPDATPNATPDPNPDPNPDATSNLNPKPAAPSQREQDINLVLLYLQALGETGQANRLLSEIDRLAPRLEASTVRTRLYRTWLYAFAYTGSVAATQAFLASRLLHFTRPVQLHWLAIAEAHANPNQPAVTSVELHPVVALRSRVRRRAQQFFQQHCAPHLPVGWRRSFRQAWMWVRFGSAGKRLAPNLAALPTQPAEPLTPDTTTRLTNLQRRFIDEVRYGFHRPLYFPLVTSCAVVCNLLAFGLETALGGSSDLRVLYFLGALVPEAVLAGQTWRLLFAMFLHFGWLHLFANMFGLFFLGQLAERWLGTLRYLLVYLASGVGSMAWVVLMVHLGWEDESQFVVGASGAVMGIFGAIAAVLWRGWQRDRSAMARDHLGTIGALFLLQTGFDFLNTQVCITCHLSGAMIGFALAWLFAPIGERLRLR